MRKALVVSTKCWGAMGNYVAAARLARLLKERLTYEVKVVSAEDYSPDFACAGAEIHKLSTSHFDADTRRSKYFSVIDELASRYPAGFEYREEFDWPGKLNLSAEINSFSPSILVGTKGFITRLLHSCRTSLANEVPLINYVTNDGLLELSIHRSYCPDVQLVQSEYGHEFLSRNMHVEIQEIYVTGRLVGSKLVQMGARSAKVPTIGILANRPGPEYELLFTLLMTLGRKIRVWVIIKGAPAMLERLVSKAPPGWKISSEVTADNYIEKLSELASESKGLLICKNGPNTVFEALTAGIPVLVLRSGLPMEEWVTKFLNETDVGFVFESVERLFHKLNHLLANTKRISKLKENAIEFSETNIDNEVTKQNLINAISKLEKRRIAKDE